MTQDERRAGIIAEAQAKADRTGQRHRVYQRFGCYMTEPIGADGCGLYGGKGETVAVCAAHAGVPESFALTGE